MNLKKANKAELILEIKRLRLFEKRAKELSDEIKRRDRATAMYRKLEKLAIEWATIIALQKTPEEMNNAWEEYWYQVNSGIMDEFWAERCADIIGEYAEYIKDTLIENQILK